jgi:hypothetical protein
LDDLPVFANEQADRLLQDLGCMGDGEQVRSLLANTHALRGLD